MHDREYIASAGRNRALRIYIQTLGDFKVSIGHKAAEWRGAGAGAKQLQRVLAYLIAHRDREVRKAELIEVAGGYNERGARNVISGVRTMLTNWGMGVALTLERLTVTLRKHESWGTDTDQIQELFDQAEALHTAGEHEQAIVLLQQAAPLCKGEYLTVLDTVPEYVPHGEISHWKRVQKNVLRLCVSLCLIMQDPKHHAQTLRLVGQLIELDRYDPTSFRLAGAANRRCGNEAEARRLDFIARDLEREM